MGRAQRPRPARLAAKLLQIRRSLNLTQQEMLEQLHYGCSGLVVGHISDFELDKREPSLSLLLRYARVAGIPLEALVDDEAELLERIERPLKNNLERIVTAIRNFDDHESIFFHEELHICLPPGFLRYTRVESDPDRHWEPVDIRLVYNHRELKFSIQLVEKSHAPAFTIIEHRRRHKDCVIEYRAAEDVKLSIKDTKRLLIFLQGYFRCFAFSLSTKGY